MRILQISNRVPWPLNEGGTLGIYNYTRSFSLLGHEVTLYCLDGLKHNTPVQEATEELSKFAKVYIHPINTDIVAADAFKSLLANESYNVKRFYNAIFEEELISLLQSQNFDVVQMEGTFTGPYIDTVRKHFRGLISLRMHNVEYEIWERLAKNEKNPLKKVYLNRLASQLKNYEKDLLKKVDVVVPVTPDDEEKFKKIAPSIKSFVSPAGIDLSYWKCIPASSFTQWYHIGSMEWHANKEAVDWYLNSIHDIMIKATSNYKLHLAGKGLDQINYESIKRLDTHSNVPSAYEFVKDKDVCVVPLKSGSGIRVKILEAMAAGKLVVSTTIGAQGISYKTGEHLLIADTPSEFNAILKKLINNEINGSQIIENARALIEKSYSTDAITARLISFYDAVIKQ
jgi:glycosyltransferase involved in cell wall biosynthesis